jgi:SAM-dependent methyltransferase
VTKAEFDEYAKTYADVTSQNTNFFDADYSYFGLYRANIIKRLSGPNIANILDFGCGVGLGIRPLREAFPNSSIVGCDPSQESLALARTSEPDCKFFESNDIEPKPQFDIVAAISVFHHITPPTRDAALSYCYERLKPGGHLFVFEHNPYNPLTRHLVARCPVDRDAILLKPKETVARVERAGFKRVAAEYCLFFPKALAFLRPLENSLGWFPLGGQYYVWGTRS